MQKVELHPDSSKLNGLCVPSLVSALDPLFVGHLVRMDDSCGAPIRTLHTYPLQICKFAAGPVANLPIRCVTEPYTAARLEFQVLIRLFLNRLALYSRKDLGVGSERSGKIKRLRLPIFFFVRGGSGKQAFPNQMVKSNEGAA